jgi:hypothetical protein
MRQLLESMPKGLLAVLLILGGILFIVLSHPPHTVCDSQIEVVNKNQRKFLVRDSKSKFAVTSRYNRLREQCFNTNTPGGCYELFHEMKTLVYDLRNLPVECASMLSDEDRYKKAIWDSTDLLVMLAWGKSPPSSPSAKFGWLEISDIALFCGLKERIIAMYGEEDWQSFYERKLTDLPGVGDLSRNQAWELSLFSENCSRYP